MALVTSLQKIEALYVAYYGRAGDPSGVTYWVDVLDNGGKSFSDVAGFFAIQPESIATYPYLANPGLVDPVSFVTQVYQNLFARAPDTAGLNYWVAALGANQGNPAFVGQFINYVIGGAAPADVAVLDNKVAAGIYFTQVVATKGFDIVGPDGRLTPEGAAAAKAATGPLVTGDPASVNASKAATDAFDVATPFHLTTATDNIIGTAGSDTITAGALAPDGVAAATTLNVLDTINGGGGIDTLVVETTGSQNMKIQGTITNVENLTIVGNGNNIANVNAALFSGTIKFQQTADTSLNMTNVTGQTVVLDRVANFASLNLGYDAAQTTATLKATGLAGSGTFNLTGATLKTANLSVDASNSVTILNASGTLETVNVNVEGISTVTTLAAGLKTVTVAGAGALTLATSVPPSVSIDASGNSGGVTLTIGLADTASFTGGSGNDKLNVGLNTKAISLGAGNDTVNFTVGALGAGGTADGGEGTDTIVLTAANAQAVTTTNAFADTINNFEKLSVGQVAAATLNTVDLARLDNISYVISAGVNSGGKGGMATGLVLDNLASGGTLELTATGATTVNVRDALAGAADTLNIVLTNDTGAALDFGSVLAANVETINIVTRDAGLSANAAATVDAATLVDTSAKSIVVTGHNGLTLINTGNTKVVSFDASGVVGDGANDTAANLAVTFTSANTTGAVSIIGGAGDDVLTGNDGVDTIKGGAGNDTISGEKGLDIITGGAGNDVFALVANSNGNIYATITDATAGDVLSFVDKGTENFDKVKITLAETAVFQDYLNEAAKANVTNDANFSWFQFGGSTYVVEDMSVETSFKNGTDIVVKLSGLVDVGTALLAGHELTLG